MLYRAIQLNNLGAVHLNAHNVGGAMRAFREGFTSLQVAAAGDSLSVEEDQTFGKDSPSGLTGPSLIQVYKLDQDQDRDQDRAITTTNNNSNTNSISSGSSSHATYYFNCPLLLDENVDLFTSVIRTLQEYLCVTNQVSAVMLFNFALAHHLQGVCQARTDLYRSAIRLYNMAAGLLQPLAAVLTNQLQQSQHSHSSCSPFLMILLCLNNTAQIYYDELCEYEPMTAVCVSMQCMIRQSLLVSDNSSVPLLLSEKDAKALTLNATMLGSPSTAGAA